MATLRKIATQHKRSLRVPPPLLTAFCNSSPDFEQYSAQVLLTASSFTTFSPSLFQFPYLKSPSSTTAVMPHMQTSFSPCQMAFSVVAPLPPKAEECEASITELPEDSSTSLTAYRFPVVATCEESKDGFKLPEAPLVQTGPVLPVLTTASADEVSLFDASVEATSQFFPSVASLHTASPRVLAVKRPSWNQSTLSSSPATSNRRRQKEKGKHTCKVCTQKFSRGHDLKRHEVIHTTSRPFPCTKCSKAFGRKDALKRHMEVRGDDHSDRSGRGCNKRKTSADLIQPAQHQQIGESTVFRVSDYVSSPSERTFSREAYNALPSADFFNTSDAALSDTGYRFPASLNVSLPNDFPAVPSADSSPLSLYH